MNIKRKKENNNDDKNENGSNVT